jgi:hypothetical protein
MRNLIPQHLFEMSKINDYELAEALHDFLYYVKRNTASDFKKIEDKLNAIKPGGYTTPGRLMVTVHDHKKREFIDNLIEWLNYGTGVDLTYDLFRYRVNTEDFFSIEMLFSRKGFDISYSYFHFERAPMFRKYAFHALDNIDKLWNSICDGAMKYLENS